MRKIKIVLGGTRMCKRVLPILWLAISLASCQLLTDTTNGSGGTKDSNLVLLNSDSMYNPNALNGYGRIIALSYTDTSNVGTISGFRETLRFYQYQDQSPNSLLSLGSVYSGIDTLYHRVTQLNLNQYWAVLTQNLNTGTQGYVSLVSLQSLPQLRLSNMITFNSTLDGANANAAFLFIYFDTNVAVYDISDVLQPSLITTYSLSSKITSSVATSSGLFYTTNTGYGYISTATKQTVVNSETADTTLRNLSKLYLYGNIAYGSGNSPILGQTSILKIDLTNPTELVILNSNFEVSQNYSDFAYDGYSSHYLVSGSTVNQYVSSTDSFLLTKSGTQKFNGSNVSKFYAWNERLFFLSGGLEEYRFK